jgi:general secretion pathway protein A
MYTSFFGFRCKPFQLTPDPEFLFMSRVHKRALTYLNYGITDNSGFILVTGEIGTGKTTIIRTLLKQIPQEIKIARINNTKVTSDQLIAMINEEFGIDTREKDKTEMLSDLTSFLIKIYSEGGRAVIIIDEAQNLSPRLLEEIRLLSNLETDKSKLLQIILMGQPELNVTLSRSELDQLRQRIAINTHISPLTRDETEDYIKHRLRIAGNEKSVSFEKGVMDAVYDFSKGIPRLINILCEFSLLAAYADEKRVLDLTLVKEVINDFINERPEARIAAMQSGNGSRQDVHKRIKNALMSYQFRLRNLEVAVGQIRERLDAHDANVRLLAMKETDLNTKEDELHKKEYTILEKDDLMKRKEEHIRYLFKKKMKEFPSDGTFD